MYRAENYPSKVLQNAVEAISSLPGIGSKSALRLALHLLKQDKEDLLRLSSSIAALGSEIHYCKECKMVSDSDLCQICSSPKRDRNLICVVESVRDVMSIEATNSYNGLYHVLGGIISPINGVSPSDLNIRELLARLKPGMEIILALSGDVEGETTSFYIYRQIEAYGVKVSTLARGLGFGDDLEYADSLTLGRSIEARRPFKP